MRQLGRIGGMAGGMALLAGCIPGGGTREAPSASAAPDSYERPAAEGVTALPAPPPAWKARKVVPDAREVAETAYQVVRGDTLRGVAEKTGAGSEAIARANGLSPPYTIYPGQRLMIPGGRYHLVRSGETGIAIARAYGVDWSSIVTLNQLQEPYILRVGQRILIPGRNAPGAPAPSLAERARAFQLDIDDLVTGSEPALAANQVPAKPTASSQRVLPSTAAVAEPARLRGRFQWPVKGEVVSRFGPGRSGERNDGITIAVPKGSPVRAAADGVVAYVGSDIPALGGLVILKHGDGWATVYGYASQLLVQRGQSVKQGQEIARSGASGSAGRPALHFEIRRGRTPVDPLTRLTQS